MKEQVTKLTSLVFFTDGVIVDTPAGVSSCWFFNSKLARKFRVHSVLL